MLAAAGTYVATVTPTQTVAEHVEAFEAAVHARCVEQFGGLDCQDNPVRVCFAVCDLANPVERTPDADLSVLVPCIEECVEGGGGDLPAVREAARQRCEDDPECP